MSNLDFNSLFGNSSVDINCPKCSKQFAIKLNQVNSTVTCPNCNVKISLNKDNSFDKSVNSVDKSLRDLKKTLNNFGK